MSWPAVLGAFSFIFVAALPGRTTFVMLVMAARGRPWGIFLGAALAFACQSIIAVTLGRVLAFFPQAWVQVATGLLFLVFSVLFWRESGANKDPSGAASVSPRASMAVTVRSTFLLVFAAEWGDISQVAIASLSARYAERGAVLLSAILALWLIAAIAVVIGSRLRRFISATKIQKAACVVFAIVGLCLVVDAIL